MKTPTSPAAQTFMNGEIHDWYRIILGYSDHLVADLLREFDLKKNQTVLDPFCGAGTTLVECMKHGIRSIGVDANPSSCFAARVKTDWTVRPEHLKLLLERIKQSYQRSSIDLTRIELDPTYLYLDQAGMLDRKWINPTPLQGSILLKELIHDLPTSRNYRDALKLALLATFVNDVSNVKFGPELYCHPVNRKPDVFRSFEARVQRMAQELATAAALPHADACVITGDSRDCARLLRPLRRKIGAVICSPPYPTEHDYTRNSRLELALLEFVKDLESLRYIKSTMIRSHTKGIYVKDNDRELVKRYRKIISIARKIDRKAKGREDGFSRLYSTVTREYFGGMKRHLTSLACVLDSGTLCAYVVGDQASYLGIHIPTAEILSSIARKTNFKPIEIRHWRNRWSTSSSKMIAEHILLMRKQ